MAVPFSYTSNKKGVRLWTDVNLKRGFRKEDLLETDLS
jgi:hypothetical protein